MIQIDETSLRRELAEASARLESQRWENTPDAWLLLESVARCLHWLREPEAAGYFRRAATAYPPDQDTGYDSMVVGNYHRLAGDTERARGMFEQALIMLQPDSPKTPPENLDLMLECQFLLGRHEEVASLLALIRLFRPRPRTRADAIARLARARSVHDSRLAVEAANELAAMIRATDLRVSTASGLTLWDWYEIAREPLPPAQDGMGTHEVDGSGLDRSVTYAEYLRRFASSRDGMNWEGADLNSMDFHGADLTGANLTSAKLRAANLRSSKLPRASLYDADLRSADLNDAQLPYALLEEADLRGASLTGADFDGANLRKANLSGLDLSAVGFETAILQRANLRHADLKDTRLGGANLGDVDLREALRVSDADWEGAYLGGANLSGLDMRGWYYPDGDASEANFAGANLEGTYLPTTILVNANLSGANLRSAHLATADLTGADLSATRLSGADLREAILFGANLRSADLTGADLRGALMDGADLDGAILTDAVR